MKKFEQVLEQLNLKIDKEEVVLENMKTAMLEARKKASFEYEKNWYEAKVSEMIGRVESLKEFRNMLTK